MLVAGVEPAVTALQAGSSAPLLPFRLEKRLRFICRLESKTFSVNQLSTLCISEQPNLALHSPKLTRLLRCSLPAHDHADKQQLAATRVTTPQTSNKQSTGKTKANIKLNSSPRLPTSAKKVALKLKSDSICYKSSTTH